MIKFFKDAVSEIHNVTWPTKKHYMHISMIVIVFTLSTAVFIWFIDYWFDRAVKLTADPVQQIQVSDVKATTTDWEAAEIEVTTEEK